MSAFSLGNGSKYEFLTGKDVLSENDLLEKAAALKRFWYSPLRRAFEQQTNVIKKQTEVINEKEDKRNKLLKNNNRKRWKVSRKGEKCFTLFTQRTGRRICWNW